MLLLCARGWIILIAVVSVCMDVVFTFGCDRVGLQPVIKVCTNSSSAEVNQVYLQTPNASIPECICHIEVKRYNRNLGLVAAIVSYVYQVPQNTATVDFVYNGGMPHKINRNGYQTVSLYTTIGHKIGIRFQGLDNNVDCLNITATDEQTFVQIVCANANNLTTTKSTESSFDTFTDATLSTTTETNSHADTKETTTNLQTTTSTTRTTTSTKRTTPSTSMTPPTTTNQGVPHVEHSLTDRANSVTELNLDENGTHKETTSAPTVSLSVIGPVCGAAVVVVGVIAAVIIFIHRNRKGAGNIDVNGPNHANGRPVPKAKKEMTVQYHHDGDEEVENPLYNMTDNPGQYDTARDDGIGDQNLYTYVDVT